MDENYAPKAIPDGFRVTMKDYIKRVSISTSILLNVLTGGKSNQTLSAQQHQRKRDKKWNICFIIDKIFWYEPEHCMDAWVKWRLIHKALNYYDNIGEEYFTKSAKKFEDFV